MMVQAKKKIYSASRVDSGRLVDFSTVQKAEINSYPWAADDDYRPFAYGQIVHDGSNLLVRLVCHESNPPITCDRPNQPVYEDSCLEFFINPCPGLNQLMDFEINAKGTLLIGCYRNDEFNLTNPAFWPDFQMQARVDSREWSVQLSIPFSFVAAAFNLEQLPDKMDVNFYKCGDKTAHPHYGCWNPIQSCESPNFFHPEYFGSLLIK